MHACLRDDSLARSDGPPSSHSPVARSGCDLVDDVRRYGVLTPVGGGTPCHILETDKALSRMGLPSILFLRAQKKGR
jgi:hypothetical protein